jgi:ribonuclease D
VHGKETRTDWRRRPLSAQQIHYAIEDVSFILPIWTRQQASLAKLKRTEWAEAEFVRLVDELSSDMTRERWLRLSGIHKLSRRELAVAREVFRWREAEALRKNAPPRRILRDDLILELAKRRPGTVKDLLATRDMNRANYKRSLPELVKCIERGLALPDAELPQPPKPDKAGDQGDEHVLGQLLGIALSNRCAEMNVARQIVGTSADLRHLARWHVYGERSGEPPRLSTGWRAEVCGRLLTDLLEGRVTLRVGDPQSDHPLVFEDRKRGS